MTIIQLLILAFLLLSFAMVLLVIRRNALGRLFFMAQFFAGALFVIFPDLSTKVARCIGVGRGTDLLLFDAQYRRDEFAAHRGFGHSTAEQGLELMERCGAKRMLLVHHDPRATDEDLRRREHALGTPAVHFAREGETVEL